MVKETKLEGRSNELNLTVVALVALVAIVGLVALVMNAANIGKVASGNQLASAADENLVGQAVGRWDCKKLNCGAGGAKCSLNDGDSCFCTNSGSCRGTVID